jgi:hypothetical protein
MGLKQYHPEFAFSGAQVDTDEIDMYVQYEVYAPGTSQTAIGTTAVGTSTQAKALVLINAVPDYPRNLFVTCSGSNDLGGTFVVNGKDQFGGTITESIGFATVVSPGTSAVGSKIFGAVTSGTWTFAAGSAGSGTPKLGVAYGGTAGSTAWFGLPVRIGTVSDVKSISITKNFVPTTLNGGTIDSTIVSTSRHAFAGTAVLGTVDSFSVTLKSTYNNVGSSKIAGL